MLKWTKKRGFPSVLSRSLGGHHSSPEPKRSRGPLGLGLLGCGLVAGFFLLLPKPAPRLRNVPLSDEQLRAVVSASRLPPTVGRGLSARVDLGRGLFHGSGLSPHEGRTCTSCHDGGRPQHAQSGAKPNPTTTSTPELANLDLNGWFGRDGRSDSLAAACLAALENPEAMGSSRLAALALVKQRYLPAYEEAFGAWPAVLANIPSAGLPAPLEHKLPINVAAQGLATLGSFPLLEGLLNQANQLHATPAVELAKRAFARTPPPAAWTAAFASLSPDQQAAANQVYAHLGQAMAVYLTGLVTEDAPYDRFAARMLQGRSANEALGEGFGEVELIGLKLFAGPGQCQGCHSGPRFSDGGFHNVGLAQRGAMVQAGRATGLQIALADPFNCRGAFLPQTPDTALLACRQLLGVPAGPGETADLGAYKTPSLRNVAKRTPYMHDGRLASLPAVIHYYNRLDEKPAIGTRDPLLRPLDFTEEEMGAVTRFLAALNAPIRDLNQLQTASARP